jgi:predicted nucleotidyltransferase
MNKTFQMLLNQVTAWAKLRPDNLGVLLVGSHASGSASVDSDVDLIILCDSPETYVNDSHGRAISAR